MTLVVNFSKLVHAKVELNHNITFCGLSFLYIDLEAFPCYLRDPIFELGFSIFVPDSVYSNWVIGWDENKRFVGSGDWVYP